MRDYFYLSTGLLNDVALKHLTDKDLCLLIKLLAVEAHMDRGGSLGDDLGVLAWYVRDTQENVERALETGKKEGIVTFENGEWHVTWNKWRPQRKARKEAV